MKAWWALLVADLRLTLRSPGPVLAMVLFSLSTLVVLQFVLPARFEGVTNVGIAGFWISMLFGGVLGLPPLQHKPSARRLLRSLSLSDITATGFFWEKLLVGFLLLVALASLLYPVAAILFQFSVGYNFLKGIIPLLIGTGGLSILITLGAVLTTGKRNWLLPVLVFPLSLPTLMSASRVLQSAISSEEPMFTNWFHLLLSSTLVFLFTGLFVSFFLWEEILPPRA